MGSSHDRAGLSVLALIPRPRGKWGAVEVYRILTPLSYINRKSRAKCGWMSLGDAMLKIASEGRTAFGHVDVVVLHKTLIERRLATGRDSALLREMGATVVYEVDDDYSGKYRPATDDRPGDWMGVLDHADAVTVTTEALRDRVLETHDLPVHVLPNQIDYYVFADACIRADRTIEGDPTIMVAGTRTHYEDWRVLAGVVPRIQEKYPNARFVVAGYTPHYLAEHDVESLPPVPYIQYPSLLRQADILLKPLVPDDGFNLCKSDIGALEGWSARRMLHQRSIFGGCAVIATDCPVYNGTIKNRKNGLLVEHTEDAWYDAISELIEDTVLRRTLQKNGHRDARERSMSVQWTKWHRVYRQLAEGGTT